MICPSVCGYVSSRVRVALGLLVGLAGGASSLRAEALLYEFAGEIFSATDGVVSVAGLESLTVNVEFDPLAPSAFSTPEAQVFFPATKSFMLTLGSGGGFTAENTDLTSVVSGLGDQWLLYGAPTGDSYFNSFPETLQFVTPGGEALELNFQQVGLYFLSIENDIFTESPPELKFPQLGEFALFESGVAELVFFGLDSENEFIQASVFYDLSVVAAPVPEPAAYALVAGLLALVWVGRRRWRQTAP